MCFQKPRFACGNKNPKLVTDHNSAVQNAQANSTRSSRNQFRDLAQSSFYPASLVSSAIVLVTEKAMCILIAVLVFELLIKC